MFLWIFPFVRQYKTDLFWYFFALGLADPISFISYSVNPKIPGYVITNLFLLFSLVYKTKNKRDIIAFIIFSLIILAIHFANPRSPYPLKVILIHSVIIYLFFKRAITFTAEKKKINLFQIFLLLEEISMITKVIYSLFDVPGASAFFLATNIFEYLFAIFFSFYREDDERIQIKLRHN